MQKYIANIICGMSKFKYNTCRVCVSICIYLFIHMYWKDTILNIQICAQVYEINDTSVYIITRIGRYSIYIYIHWHTFSNKNTILILKLSDQYIFKRIFVKIGTVIFIIVIIIIFLSLFFWLIINYFN